LFSWLRLEGLFEMLFDFVARAERRGDRANVAANGLDPLDFRV
jgi:hypothetical protein